MKSNDFSYGPNFLPEIKCRCSPCWTSGVGRPRDLKKKKMSSKLVHEQEKPLNVEAEDLMLLLRSFFWSCLFTEAPAIPHSGKWLSHREGSYTAPSSMPEVAKKYQSFFYFDFEFRYHLTEVWLASNSACSQ